MSESLTWEKTTLLGGSKALKDLTGLVEGIQTAASATGAVVSAGVAAGQAFTLASINPRLVATIVICDQIIEQIENIEQAGFYFTYVDPYMPGVGTFDKTSFTHTLTASEAVRKMAAACTDAGDPNRPQFSDSAEVGALVVLIATGSIDLFAAGIEAYGRLFNIKDWEDLKDDLAEIWTPYDQGEIVTSSTPPDFKAVRFSEAVPLLGSGLASIKGIAQAFKAPAEASLKSVNRLLAFLDKKEEQFGQALQRFINDLDTALSIAENSGAYVLVIPKATGGTDRIKNLMDDSAGQLLSELNYSAGCLLVADGISYGVLKEMLL